MRKASPAMVIGVIYMSQRDDGAGATNFLEKSDQVWFWMIKKERQDELISGVGSILINGWD